MIGAVVASVHSISLPYRNFVTAIGNQYKPLVFKSREAINKLLKERILINQSTTTLTNEEIETLCLGLNFIPTYPHNNEETTIDTQRWIREINLSMNFLGKETNTKKSWLRKYVKSDFNPEQDWNEDPDFVNKNKQLSVPVEKKTEETPLGIIEALKKLKNRKDVHLMKSDKGRNTVIWATEDYDREALRQLSDKSTYKEISKSEYDNMTMGIHNRSCTISENLLAFKHISDQDDEAIRKTTPGGSYIYFLPKIHKDMNPASRTFAGRPIVATFTSTTYLIDKLLAELTRILLPRIPGSLIDTNDLLRKLPKSRLPATTKITTADVASLYPSIPWTEGVTAATQFYRDNFTFLVDYAERNCRLPPPSPYLFQEMLELVLQHSIIIFKNKKYYHQIKGTAMGCCISVYFANCYMYATTRHILDNTPVGVTLFSRYIDDILLISSNLEVNAVNTLFRSITNEHIRYEISDPSDSQPFLDLKISLNKESKLETEPYCKPTSSGLFLHPASNHPTHTIQGVPYAQFLRLKRNSSSAMAFIKSAKKLRRQLLNMEYNKRIVDAAYTRALTWKKTRKQKETAGSHKLMVTHSNTLNWTHTKELMDLTYLSLVTHYHKKNTPLSTRQASYLIHRNTALVSTVRPNLNDHFSRQIKQGSGNTL